MFDHPFPVTLFISLVLSFLKVIFLKHTFIAFFAQFINFPYWAVLLVFLLFAILRRSRDSRAYRFLHTIYHEQRGVRSTNSLVFTPQPDEFGLTPQQ